MTNSSPSSVLKAVSAAVLCAALGCAPGDGSRELEAGRAAFEAGDFKKAEKLLAKCAELSPTNVEAVVYLARMKLQSGEIAEAGQYVARAAALAGGDSDVRLLGAQVAWHQKDYARAADLFAGIADDASLDARLRSQGWTGLGIVEMGRNDKGQDQTRYDLARIAFIRAIRADRRNASAYYHLGHLYRYAPFGYAEAALEQFEIFVRLDSETSSPRVQKTQRSIIPDLKESIARAATERPGAAQRNSAVCQALISRAEDALKKGNVKVARSCFKEACEADPLSFSAALGLAKAELKADSSAAGQRRAFESYRKACSLRPGAVSTLVETGLLAERLALHAQAREIYSRAVAANPASLDAIDGLIRSLGKAGDKSLKALAQAYQRYRDTLPTPKKRRR